jgi:hypothetical protein
MLLSLDFMASRVKAWKWLSASVCLRLTLMVSQQKYLLVWKAGIRYS